MAKAKKQLPVILITNDDDITAKGIRSLVEAVQDLGKVVVVAPNTPQSGMGPVSYTHLDVYKRQQSRFTGLLKQNR